MQSISFVQTACRIHLLMASCQFAQGDVAYSFEFCYFLVSMLYYRDLSGHTMYERIGLSSIQLIAYVFLLVLASCTGIRVLLSTRMPHFSMVTVVCEVEFVRVVTQLSKQLISPTTYIARGQSPIMAEVLPRRPLQFSGGWSGPNPFLAA
jgi:hypothetical protein